jgi:branched-chain amino acid transport system ATP-binding protein
MFPKLTVRESLDMGRIASGRVRRDRTDEVLEYFPHLRDRLGQLAGTMSGGEQQMLAIGRGLMTDPRLMLLDEPSDGIMPTLVKQVAETLVQINRTEGMTIIIVEQNVPMVFAMAERCIILEKGRIVAGGTREEVSGSELMQQYLAI